MAAENIDDQLVDLPQAEANPPGATVIAPLSPSQDTQTDQLSSFYTSILPMTRHSPLPVTASSASGAQSSSISQTSAQRVVLGGSANLAQITAAKFRQGLNLDDIPNGAEYAKVEATFIADGVPFVFAGAWNTLTFYPQGSEVTFTNDYWLCLVSNVGQTPNPSSAFWLLVSNNSSLYEGVYSSIVNYVVGNQVTFTTGGTTNYYICVADTIGHDPTNATFWQIIGNPTTDIYIGVWSVSTAYVAGNQVSLAGAFYICIVSNTGQTPSATSTFWTLLGTSTILIGAWSSATAYQVNNEVTFNFQVFKCIVANTNNQPDISPTFWLLMGQQGLPSGIQPGTGNVLLKNITQALGTTSNPTTTSGTYATIPEMTLTVASKGNPMLVTFSGSFLLNNSSTTTQVTAEVALFRGSTQITPAPGYFVSCGLANTSPTSVSTTGFGAPITITFLDQPGVGTFTWTIKWNIFNGTGTFESVGTVRTFQIVELG